MGSHVLEVDMLLVQEAQRLVHILQAVDPHLAFGGAGLEKIRALHLCQVYAARAYMSFLWLL